MATVKLFNHPRVLYQAPDEEYGISEPALACSIDNIGTIIIAQEGREILLNRESVPGLCRLLRELAKLAGGGGEG